jgi:hypothetical protein
MWNIDGTGDRVPATYAERVGGRPVQAVEEERAME